MAYNNPGHPAPMELSIYIFCGVTLDLPMIRLVDTQITWRMEEELYA